MTKFGNLIAPVEGEFLSGYEDTRSGGSRAHHAGDIAAPPGSPVFAPADMELIARGQGGKNLRDNDHWAWFKDVNTGKEYRFAHNTGEVMHLEPGTIVKAGQVWDTVGQAIDHPHLHFQMFDPEKNESINWTQTFKRGDRIGGGFAQGQQQQPQQQPLVASQGQSLPFPMSDPGALKLPTTGFEGLAGMQGMGAQPQQTTAMPQGVIHIPGDPAKTISSRQNNAFNINFAGQEGATAGAKNPDGGQFAIFQTPEAGVVAGINLIKRYQSQNPTLGQFIKKYNATAKSGYIQGMRKLTGANLNTPIAKIDTNVLARAVAKLESGTDIPQSFFDFIGGQYAGNQ